MFCKKVDGEYGHHCGWEAQCWGFCCSFVVPFTCASLWKPEVPLELRGYPTGLCIPKWLCDGLEGFSSCPRSIHKSVSGNWSVSSMSDLRASIISQAVFVAPAFWKILQQSGVGLSWAKWFSLSVWDCFSLCETVAGLTGWTLPALVVLFWSEANE